uniref:Uncharacterized protein n=1 Tax=Haptolina brevifila TaxID=156173 RepID=A0A7S2DL87_9EUKA|mmetsp:Transcript_40411/g.80967  ORF Transcript_40411/g.80967 Transcript_40411/m.80967 type:complete len:198 (+) Transcript_40411:149-742(+)|eukprot:CAMPEP_0174734612 /NCGR_PEP_ID=MMETSP1094-20130205/63639_1 /TAXON_ID=156173 /ORGANISM="Chrysochromulina brevifilum, Strain UTEX LB 985" /LENGTH=197 /DNA_ID=CAMNT_0015937455 /DNA_START=144 /DNA_END=737 /DNA_ORIENTATION=+
MDTSSVHSDALNVGRPASAYIPRDNAITRLPLPRLARMMSWGNRANGVLLVVTGVLGLIGAITHDFASALLSIYVGGFGSLLLWYEFGPVDTLRHDCGFMHTYLGRAAFLLLSANLSWTCVHLGLVTAVVTNANAIFSAYVMWVHPAFTEGQVSWTAIHGNVHDQSTEVFVSDSALDPASVSARSSARAAVANPQGF